ncbi:MAG: hypothetical protein HQL31_12235, partial [Planctomycetes bacterium]|nr:hypothetical protein [Planctomycetota bacterium]
MPADSDLLFDGQPDPLAIEALLGSQGEEAEALYRRANEVRCRELGSEVYLRGLIGISNICRQNCLYCGLRGGNWEIDHYRMEHGEILAAARDALEFGF